MIAAEDALARDLERRYGRPGPDRCETCGRPLRPRAKVEIIQPARPGMTEFGFGGGAVSALFCPVHAPQEAT